MPDPTTTRDLINEIGSIAAGEFNSAPEYAKVDLLAWIGALPGLSDQEFAVECQRAIYDSAAAGRFKGNWNHDHCRASACWNESVRRHARDGHDGDCRGPSLYSRAHAAVMRSHGYTPTADGECRCDLGGGDA